MYYFCCDKRRRNLLGDRSSDSPPIGINGIDFLEVSDNPEDPVEDRQRRLFLHFINDTALSTLDENNILIEGGERIKNITVRKVALVPPGSPPSSPPLPGAGEHVLEVVSEHIPQLAGAQVTTLPVKEKDPGIATRVIMGPEEPRGGLRACQPAAFIDRLAFQPAQFATAAVGHAACRILCRFLLFLRFPFAN